MYVVNFLGHNFIIIVFFNVNRSRLEFLFVSGTSLLILSYEPHEKFKAQD